MRSNSGGDLYSFGSHKITAPLALTASSSSAEMWHRHLGHPGQYSLARLVSDFSLPCTTKTSTTGVCDACQRGRHVRLPFSSSTSFTYFPFQIIHCDLWTSPIVSFTGYKYYLILVDDYTHYMWSFPLRQKSDATITIKHFYAHILNQFHLSIHVSNVTMGGNLSTTNFVIFFKPWHHISFILPLHVLAKWESRESHSYH
jgi:hypothetical protein